jgi:hypothetical protein
VTTQALKMLAVGGALYLVGVSSPDSQVTVNHVDEPGTERTEHDIPHDYLAAGSGRPAGHPGAG